MADFEDASFGAVKQTDENEETVFVNASDTFERERPINIFTLYRYRTILDVVLIVLGTLAAVTAGCLTPTDLILFGRVITLFVDATVLDNGTDINVMEPYHTLFDETFSICVMLCILGVSAFVSMYIAVASLACVAERQIQQIRIQFFQSVLQQDIAWFEIHKNGELNTRCSDDMLNIYEGIGDKMVAFIQFIFTWLSSIVIALILDWRVSLVCISFTPVIVMVAMLSVKFLQNVTKLESERYAKAGAVASEAFTAIRTVHAFQGQEKECMRYDGYLNDIKSVSARKGLAIGISTSIFWIVFFIDFSVSLWYSVWLIQTENHDPGSLVPIVIIIMRGSAYLGLALPYLETLSTALGSAGKVFAIIDCMPVMGRSSDCGQQLEKISGRIQFRNVSFSYPSRPDVQVLKHLNLTVPQGKVVALVGPSGSGKSTIVQLLQRFYDPHEGQILLDNHDIRDLNIKWLRHQFGVVSQEPVLFDTTISENIRYGNMDIDQKVVEKAARDANAHDFISQLPQGYETVVGNRGAQLSGGQKQRVAIVRALVRDPKILLLDEATSALDHHSEALVQSALEQAEKGRTTLVVAHRLSTVQNADSIVTLNQGEVVEQGTHRGLLKHNGLYAKLVKQQVGPHVSERKDGTLIRELENFGDGYQHNEHVVKTTGTYAEEQQICTVKKETHKPIKKDASSSSGVSILRILRVNSPEWLFLLFGCTGAIIAGLLMPCFVYNMAEFLRIFALRNNEEKQSRLTDILCLTMLGVGVLTSVAKCLQWFCFGKSGAALTTRVRSITFRAIVNQDIDFFDEAENQVGFLVTRLGSDAQLIQNTTTQLGYMIEACSTVCGVMVIAFIYGWKLGLALSCFMPVLIGSGIIDGKLMEGLSNTDKTKIEKCGKICSEATDHIRTVASLCREDTFLNKYETVVNEMYRYGLQRSHVRGLTHGICLCIPFFTYVVAFSYGSFLIQNKEIEFYDVFRILSAVVLGSQWCGRALSSSGEYRRGRDAASRLFHIIDRPTVISVGSPQGKSLEDYSGHISLQNVIFRYKSRPTVSVLNGVNFTVQSGETVALVGSSGSGKSTILQLIERFYDVEKGAVLADTSSLPSLDLKWWRSQLALVSQEPILFDCSIADNIAYGDNSRVVSMEEIIAAARMASIHTFIETLPLGYETNAGIHGTQLSGGQKQRVAIARALVRNPKVLLLDEATSSLDSESERVIQETLDKARIGRTCIVVAHRLSTIQNADKIAVVSRGQIIEFGSHIQLVSKKGAYFQMVQSQNRGDPE